MHDITIMIGKVGLWVQLPSHLQNLQVETILYDFEVFRKSNL